jgi:polar amino acid transport system substrate-binding protein
VLTALVALAALLAGAVAAPTGLAAQSAGAGSVEEPADARGRLYRSIIRFVTESDYPPFNYLDEDGTLTGFNVDIARALCLELDVSCDVQARQWRELVPALKRGETDAVIASIAISPRSLADMDFTDRYYFTPARFAARKGTLARVEVTAIGLEGKKVGVTRGSAHEAYLKVFFRDCNIQAFDSPDQARDALAEGKVELVFDDGISLSFWLNGTNSRGCCEFRGGPFFDPRYFGDGVGVAVRKGDQELKRLINLAIKRVRESGQYEEISKRYFPLKVN